MASSASTSRTRGLGRDNRVNGMVGTLYTVGEGYLILKLKNGRYLCVPRTSVGEGDARRVFFPVRQAYAVIVDKAQVLEFPHVTVFFDVANPAPGVGYVMVSRTKSLAALAFLGSVQIRHFCPSGFSVAAA